MAYAYRPYPKMLFHATLAPVVVVDAIEHLQFPMPPWSEEPITGSAPLLPVGYVDADGFIVVVGNAPYKVEIIDQGGGYYLYRLLVKNGAAVVVVAEYPVSTAVLDADGFILIGDNLPFKIQKDAGVFRISVKDDDGSEVVIYEAAQ